MASWSGDYSTETRTDNGQEYTYVKVHSGRLTIILDDGDNFENYLIDQTNSGTRCTVLSQGSWRGTPPSSYTIRNVGWDGPSSGGDACLITSCTGEALVENIYLGDGTTAYPHTGSNWNDNAGAMRASPEHSGHLTFRGCYYENWVDNAMYCSPPASPGPGGGTFTVENCYSIDSSIACYRFGTDTVMRNCYGRTDSHGHRVLWAYEGGGNIECHDCSFDGGSRAVTFSGGVSTTVDLNNSEYTGTNNSGNLSGGVSTSNPTHFVPEGCPQTALEAATGSPSGDGTGGSAPPADGSGNRDIDWGRYEPRHAITNVHVQNESSNSVGLRVRNGKVVADRCEISGPNPRITEAGGEIDSVNSNWGDEAEPSPPDGVPLSVAEASGEINNSSDP